MTNLGHLIVCDEVFNGPNGDLILKQPLGMIVPTSLPTNYTFVISVGLINLKANEPQTLTVKMISPSGDEILKHDLDFELEEDDTNPDVVSVGGFTINCRNIELEEEGNHIVIAEIGSEKKELVLPVFAKKRK